MDLYKPYAMSSAVFRELLSARERMDATKAAPAKVSPAEAMDFSGGVAIIPVEGILTKRPTIWRGLFQETITGDVERDLRAALSLTEVKAIILSIDSPGGTVDGTADLAAWIFGARGDKPIAAWTDGMMTSAAYWLGAAADRVFISGDTVQVGSIGVVAAHRDISKAEEKLGIKTTEITAGKYKRIASSYAPLTDEGRQSVQDAVDHYYSVFVADVARFRGTTENTVLTRMADGRTFFGRQAVDAGLVDGVSTLEELVSSLATGKEIPGSSGKGKVFFDLVDDYQAMHGCSRGEAVRKTVNAYPEAHERYLQELRG